MADIEVYSATEIADALAAAGQDEELRRALLDSLRAAQLRAADGREFRERVRWPLIVGLLARAQRHQVHLRDGLTFEVSLDSRIEKALLLSTDQEPDHIWEPQTTRLLCALSEGAGNVIIGGAYIGDHALLIAARLRARGEAGIVHAFEPMSGSYAHLLRNIELNGLKNVRPQQLGLWSDSGGLLSVDGPAALASSHAQKAAPDSEQVRAISIDDYVAAHDLQSVDLIMLDTEGGEEEALRGARTLLGRGKGIPNIVFEIHRSFVDWSNGLPSTSVIKMLADYGYEVFAIRDFHDNCSMAGRPIELVPAATVYLEGPPHGFNMLATRQSDLVQRLGLRVVNGVSPKLLLDKDPRLHHPLS
jgi:FkbM family methyltransferase